MAPVPPSRTAKIVTRDGRLPLTCTRQGTCCHGKLVWVNPWELALLARQGAIAVGDLIASHTCDGGIRLRFAGAAGWQGLPACTFYGEQGCRVHASRPLACRLYPLGRERRGEAVHYLFDGPDFPCLAGCPTVTSLPALAVGEYLHGQDVTPGEAISDAYLEVVQDLAERAFVLAVDSGLAASGYRGLPARWQALADMPGAARARALPEALRTLLLAPGLDAARPDDFVARHAARLQEHAQEQFAGLGARDALADASCAMLGCALHLAASLGADLSVLIGRWLAVARSHGLR